MSNRYTALMEASSESESASDVSDVDTEPQTKKSRRHEPPERENSSQQQGGMFVQRFDPVTGVDPGHSDLLETHFSDSDVEACIKVLTSVGNNIHLLKLPKLKPLRAALHPLIVEQMKNYGRDSSVDTSKEGRRRKRGGKQVSSMSDIIKMQKEKLAQMEKDYINQTQLKALRLQQLEKLNEEGGEVPRVPDGVALLADGQGCVGGPQLIKGPSAPLCITNGTEPLGTSTSSDCKSRAPPLLNPISCYICRKPYTELHFFYHQLCPDCAAFNYSKREEKADLSGMVCLVTGARTKIGYRSALKLLRCGATVIGTTRFPANAAARYAAEHDSSKWIHRLQIYGLDFRDLNKLEAFCVHLEQTYDRLDAIVNNACQTIRRPPAYYAHLIENEESCDYAAALKTAPSRLQIEDGDVAKTIEEEGSTNDKSKIAAVLHQQAKFIGVSGQGGTGEVEAVTTTEESSKPGYVHNSPALNHTVSALSSSSMTQLQLAPGDDVHDPTLFPRGRTDVNGQQVDLRRQNSWTMKLHEVSTAELAEVFAINAMAPTIINSRLKRLMQRAVAGDEDNTRWRFIVNVSAMEGKFYRYKSENHPHTNMAKAALNMMTRTSAQDYVKSNIYMTAVDTGWINDEKPIDRAMAHEKQHNFQTPLDELDAASRVLDPIISPIKALQETSGEATVSDIQPPWGYFLKDYMKCEW